MPKVSIIMATYNNASYLEQAIDSVLHQTYSDWEMVIVNDSSTDGTQGLLDEYYGDPRIKIVTNSDNLGLTKSCNIALRISKGEYIMRLDGDDRLDENAVAILAMILDNKPDIDLVDCDHFLTDENGDVIEYVRRKKLYDEAEVLDLPPISTAVMIRRRCYEALNGYNEQLGCQDTYDLWMRFIQKFKAYNINLPLWYYRQHHGTLTTNKDRILQTRRYAKKEFVKDHQFSEYGKPRVLAIIPIRASSSFPFKLALYQVAGQPLLFYTIRTALSTEILDRVVLTTEDSEIADFGRRSGVEVIMRSLELARMKVPIEGTIDFVLGELRKDKYEPDIVAILHANSPLMTRSNIEEAINTLLIFHTDSVISVCPDHKLHYTHDKHGLTPLFRKRRVRLEREELYDETGAIYVSWRDVISRDSFIGNNVGHIIMTPEESVHIDDDFDLRIARKLLEEKEGK